MVKTEFWCNLQVTQQNMLKNIRRKRVPENKSSFTKTLQAFHFIFKMLQNRLDQMFFFSPIRFYFKTSICSILIICFQKPGMIPNMSYGNIMLLIKERNLKPRYQSPERHYIKSMKKGFYLKKNKNFFNHIHRFS